ncbi:hypothetical protein [Lacrimispora xylanolytica]|uniref:Uncharacterized protein n=1 Tax=Lacrimispora xylanolytica TaxID=29375 RepID=A0ABY7A7B2_9FIRM|nr:hypothetical protein [Lacrimispora xylanolytica]WAJ22339.1 hypothetical protein OW255_12210 [Lacrimispora xylanolytica]
MIENLLNTYITKLDEKDHFVKNITQANLLNKITLIFIFSGLSLLPLYVHFKYQSIFLIGLFLYVFIVYVLMSLVEHSNRKNWNINLDKYIDSLDVLKNILKLEKYDLYEKYKIKQLIRRYNQSIEKIERESERRGERNIKFLNTYILPVVGFSVGRITSGIAAQDIIIMALYILSFISLFMFLFLQARELMEIIDGNRLEKKKNIVIRLQDLLDRDFEILEDDLI